MNLQRARPAVGAAGQIQDGVNGTRDANTKGRSASNYNTSSLPGSRAKVPGVTAKHIIVALLIRLPWYPKPASWVAGLVTIVWPGWRGV